MTYKISEIEGIGPVYSDKLAKAKISSTEDLLDLCSSPSGRKDVAGKTGCTERQILGWANMADLMRLKGVGPEYAELLEASGVDTVKELRNRRPDNLATKMAEVNEQKKLTRKVPTEGAIKDWVEEAKGLPPKITF